MFQPFFLSPKILKIKIKKFLFNYFTLLMNIYMFNVFIIMLNK